MLESVKHPKKIYEQLPEYLNHKFISTLCWACAHTCATCPYLMENKLPKGTIYEKTIIKNSTLSVPTYESKKILYCSMFCLMQDYYSTESDKKRYMAYLADMSLGSVTKSINSYELAWKKYSKLCPRSKHISMSKRKRIFKLCLEKAKKVIKSKKRKEKTS